MGVSIKYIRPNFWSFVQPSPLSALPYAFKKRLSKQTQQTKKEASDIKGILYDFNYFCKWLSYGQFHECFYLKKCCIECHQVKQAFSLSKKWEVHEYHATHKIYSENANQGYNN